MRFVTLRILLAPSEPEEGSAEDLLSQLGIDQEEEESYREASLNLDHVSAFFRLYEDQERPILVEYMGSQAVVDTTYKGFLTLIKKVERSTKGDEIWNR